MENDIKEKQIAVKQCLNGMGDVFAEIIEFKKCEVTMLIDEEDGTETCIFVDFYNKKTKTTTKLHIDLNTGLIGLRFNNENGGETIVDDLTVRDVSKALRAYDAIRVLNSIK